MPKRHRLFLFEKIVQCADCGSSKIWGVKMF